MSEFDKSLICKLINAAIEEEANAGRDYAEVLSLIPKEEEYKECAETIVKIMEDEANHALRLIKIGNTLGCENPNLSKDDEELIELSKRLHKIKYKFGGK
jgi:rubrerythrin